MVLHARRRYGAMASLAGMAAFAVTGIAITTTTATRRTAAPSPPQPSVLAANTAANLVNSRPAVPARQPGRRLHRAPGHLGPAGPAVRALRPHLQGPAGLSAATSSSSPTPPARCSPPPSQQTSTINLSHHRRPDRRAGRPGRPQPRRRQDRRLRSRPPARWCWPIGTPRLAWETVVSSHTGADPQQAARVHRRHHRRGRLLLRRGARGHRHRQVERPEPAARSTPPTPAARTP